jgi:hypothetical protein
VRTVAATVLMSILVVVPSALPAQCVPRPGPSALWSAAPRATLGAQSGALAGVMSRGDGFAIGAVVGALAAGVFGFGMCRVYGTEGDCWGQAAWWGVLGGMVGGLIGASGGKDSVDEPGRE